MHQQIHAWIFSFTHHIYTTNGSNNSFITTQCTYWVLIQPDQRALITHISGWRLQWVGTTHTNKTLFRRLQFLMCVYENVWVRLSCDCEPLCTLERVCARDAAAPGAQELY